MPGKIFKTITAQGGSATKEFFVPCTCGGGGGVLGFYGCYPVGHVGSSGDYILTSFRVPHNYSSIVVASIIVIPKMTTANADWNIYSNYAQTGEGYQTHSESDIATTYNVTDDQIFEVSIAGILTSLVANDMVGIKFMLVDSVHDADVLGVRFKYS